MSLVTPNGDRESQPAGGLDPSAPAPAEPPPRWAHYETDLSSVLAFAPHDVPLEILRIADEGARAYCTRIGLESGNWITRTDGRKDDVLLTTPDGRRLRLALPVALFVEVEPAFPS